MKRVVYSIPLFFLLLPWLFFSMVVLAVATTSPYVLLLLLPTGALLGTAFMVHQNRAKHGQHGLAALLASGVLAAPIVALLISFFGCGGKEWTINQMHSGNLSQTELNTNINRYPHY